MKRRIWKKRLFFLLAVGALVQFGIRHYRTELHRREQQELAALAEDQKLRTGRDAAAEKTDRLLKELAQKQEEEPQILERFISLLKENEDIIGWLSVEGMKIDYPVMQCEDDEYYLHHNFYGEEDAYGCLFVKEQADLLTPGTNVIIYGHNMRDGSMFGDLDRYREEAFYREHPILRMDTLYEERGYEILAVFLSQVYRENDEAFKYYQFYQAENEEDFNDFYENVKALALYDTGVTAEYGDTFVTLSTCAYHVEDGRLVVVAKRITD